MSRKANVIKLYLSPIRAKQILKKVVNESGKVFFTTHAEERMIERNITRSQILRCLKNGTITEGPVRNTKGNWELRIHIFSAGENITTIAALDKNEDGDYIIVITAYN